MLRGAKSLSFRTARIIYLILFFTKHIILHLCVQIVSKTGLLLCIFFKGDMQEDRHESIEVF